MEVVLLGVAMSMGEVLDIIERRELLVVVVVAVVVVVVVIVMSSSGVGGWREERGEDVAEEESRSRQSASTAGSMESEWHTAALEDEEWVRSRSQSTKDIVRAAA